MKRFINTEVVYQWDAAAQDYVLIKKVGYWYDGPMSLCMDTPTMRQDAIQLFNDNGTDETDSTSKAGIGVDVTGQALDENILVRFVVQETAGNSNNNYRPALQSRLNGGTYQVVNASSTIARTFASSVLTDAQDTTQRVGSGSFVSPNQGVDTANGVAGGTAYVGNDETEYVFCFQIRSADVSPGDNVDLRISDTNIDVYGDPEIRVTIEVAGDIAATSDLAFSFPAADLNARGKLDAAAALAFGAPVVDLTNATQVGAIDATAALAFGAPVVDLDARGKLDATAALVFASPSTDLNARGKLDAAAALLFGAPVVDLTNATQVGAIDATVPLLFGAPVVDILATGKLDATAALLFSSPSTDLNARGKLDAAAALAFGAPVVDLTDASIVGAIDATVALLFGAPVVDIRATGKLDATAPLSFASPSTDLNARGKLDATAALAFGAPVVDLQDGAIVGPIAATVPLTFTVGADLAALGRLAASVPMDLVVSANISDATAVGGPFTGRHLAPFVS